MNFSITKMFNNKMFFEMENQPFFETKEEAIEFAKEIRKNKMFNVRVQTQKNNYYIWVRFI